MFTRYGIMSTMAMSSAKSCRDKSACKQSVYLCRI